MVRLIQDNFVAVSVSNFDRDRRDAVGEFVRACGMQFPRAGGSRWFVTADGKLLGNDPRLALKQWRNLPASQRKPGAVHVAAMKTIDSERALTPPPEGALILKVYYRAFMRRDEGGLRYVRGADLWHDEIGKRAEGAGEEVPPDDVTVCIAADEPAGPRGRHAESLGYGSVTTPQAQPDHVWLAESEWRALMPAQPRRGDNVPVPASLADRLVRCHLNPLHVYGEANPLEQQQVRAAEVTLTVAETSADVVRLRLEGFARLGKAVTPAVKKSRRAFLNQWGYEPRLLGYLEYNPRTRTFTRFDVVALGDQFGRLGLFDSAARPGLQPLGIAFELVRHPAPADRIPPGRTMPARTYFDSSKW